MRAFRLICAVLTAFILVLPTVASAAPGHQKVDRALRALVDSGRQTQQVIVTVNPGCRAAVRTAMEIHGDRVDAEHDVVDAVAGEVHSRDVDELAKSPCVKAVSSNATVYASGASAGKSVTGMAPLSGPPPAISVLRDVLGLPHLASLDPSVPTGASGVGVAIIDSGIAPGADFGGRIVAFYDFTRGGKATTPYDDFGHGTHVAGLIGSSGRLSNYEFQGVAPDVRLVGLKVLDDKGAGRTSDVIKAIEFVIKNHDWLNVQVINLSLGHPILAPADDDPLVQAVERATAAGLIVVTASGNQGLKDDGTSGYAGITSPGNAPSAITVGAADNKDTITRLDDTVAPYSSRGPTWFDAFVKPDVVAPGNHLASDTSLASYLYQQLPKNRVPAKNGQQFLSLSGSSMAAAVTTGVVALVLQAHNENPYYRQRALTPNLVKGILQYSAIPIAGADYLTQGTGQLNAAGAIALSAAIDTSKWLGATWLKPVTPVSVIGGQAYFWGRHVLYGNTLRRGNPLLANNIVWGTNLVWGTFADRENDNIVWGTSSDREDDNIVWGTSSDREGDNIVWGTNIVWSTRVIGQRVGGTAVVWGANIVWGTNIVWSTMASDNIVWGTVNKGSEILWGTSFGNDVVWGKESANGKVKAASADTEGDNIVWGTFFSIQ
jgi:serine protease AprX